MDLRWLTPVSASSVFGATLVNIPADTVATLKAEEVSHFVLWEPSTVSSGCGRSRETVVRNNNSEVLNLSLQKFG